MHDLGEVFWIRKNFNCLELEDKTEENFVESRNFHPLEMIEKEESILVFLDAYSIVLTGPSVTKLPQSYSRYYLDW